MTLDEQVGKFIRERLDELSDDELLLLHKARELIFAITHTAPPTPKGTEMKTCSICGDSFHGFGHNPQPVKPEVGQRCCDSCNSTRVIPARLRAAGL